MRLYAAELSVLVTTLVIAAFTDYKTDKVPNVLTGVAFALTGLIRCLSLDAGRIIEYVAGAALPLLVLIIFFVFRFFGAGDIKLLCLTGAVCGLMPLVRITVISLFVGALFSVLKIICKKNLLVRMQYLANYFSNVFTTGEITPYYREEIGRGNMIHFSICILLGVLIYGGCVYGRGFFGLM